MAKYTEEQLKEMKKEELIAIILAPKEKKTKNRVYKLVDADVKAIEAKCAKMPTQAKVCVSVMIGAGKPVSEEELMDLINKSTLETKQEKWRIFQYYRPMLIAADVIRMESIDAA